MVYIDNRLDCHRTQFEEPQMVRRQCLPVPIFFPLKNKVFSLKVFFSGPLGQPKSFAYYGRYHVLLNQQAAISVLYGWK